jgi:3-methylcrotonyl-CoA carboxylase alpha subunit
MFRKILIANRGEIAVRIIRACRELGVSPVVVYSEADQAALHVRLADEAVPIGPAPASQSYLRGEEVIKAALQTGAEAVHPGYGFLAENAQFASAVQEAGLVFIGPPPEAIRQMGDKAGAREKMLAAGVPVVPGYQRADDEASLVKEARKIGFPVLVKAAAGGGGKGMRIIRKESEALEAIGAARRESRHAFGDERLILESYIPRSRHIEFQVFADQHGKTLHFFERECTIQRRHQKIIEETPSPHLNEALRAEMGAAAIAAAQSVGYQNAGTVEFIVDPEKRAFYFLEMNTRLQVEHPITEMVVGLDLVQWQLRVAAGERLPFEQDDIHQHCHALECRLYAEDPAAGFLPQTGPLLRFIQPQGPGVRVDTGFTSGDEISLHYDPLIAKIVTSGEDRLKMIRRMQNALRETVVLGITTNWQFLQAVLEHPDFQAGDFYTTWVEENFQEWQAPECDLPPEVLAAAVLTQFQPDRQAAGGADGAPAPDEVRTEGDPFSPWGASSSFRLGEWG